MSKPKMIFLCTDKKPKDRILPGLQDDISSRRSRPILESLRKVNFGNVVAVREEIREYRPPAFLNMGTQESWSYDNEQRFIFTQSARDLVEERMNLWLAEG